MLSADAAIAPVLKAKAESRIACVSHHLGINPPGLMLASDLWGWMEPDGETLLGVWSGTTNTIIASVEDGERVLAEVIGHELAHAANGRDEHGPHADHGPKFAEAFMRSMRYMAHCKLVGNDLDAPYVEGDLPKGASGKVVRGPFDQHEFLFYDETYDVVEL